ncbi:MAG: class I SAM-dependent methyltransferase [Pirellulaceae bacterium]
MSVDVCGTTDQIGLGQMPPTRTCPVCGGQRVERLGDLRYAFFPGTPLAEAYPVVSCQGCGFVTCRTPSTQRDLDRFYADYACSPTSAAHALREDERQYYREMLELATDGLSPDRDVLFDVGCGSGNFLRVCRDAGWTQLYGIDPATSCSAALHSAGFHAALGGTANLPFREIQPSVIVLSHTLEHVLDLPATLASLRGRLRHGGRLYIEVPDAARYDAIEPDAPLRFFYPQHLLHLDAVHLDNLLLSHGFRKTAGGVRERIEHELTLPAIWATYVCDAPFEPGGATAWRPDSALAQRMRTWFERAEPLDPTGIFSELAERGDPVYVWGVGIHVQMMLGMSPLRRCRIVCCVDQNPRLHSQRLQGHAIVSPDVLRSATARDTVVIGSRIHRDQMMRQLRESIHFPGRVVTV